MTIPGRNQLFFFQLKLSPTTVMYMCVLYSDRTSYAGVIYLAQINEISDVLWADFISHYITGHS